MILSICGWTTNFEGLDPEWLDHSGAGHHRTGWTHQRLDHFSMLDVLFESWTFLVLDTFEEAFIALRGVSTGISALTPP